MDFGHVEEAIPCFCHDGTYILTVLKSFLFCLFNEVHICAHEGYCIIAYIVLFMPL